MRYDVYRDGAYLCPSCKGATLTLDNIGNNDVCVCKECGCEFVVDYTTIPEGD